MSDLFLNSFLWIKGKGSHFHTFKSWGKEAIIDYEVEDENENEKEENEKEEEIEKEEENDSQYVTQVWCKICRSNANAIQLHPSCRGPARMAMLAYVLRYKMDVLRY